MLRPGPDFRGSLIAWLLIQYLRDSFPQRRVLAIDGSALHRPLVCCPGPHVLNLPHGDCRGEQYASCRRCEFCQMLSAVLEGGAAEIVIDGGTEHAHLELEDWLRQELLASLSFYNVRPFIHVVLTGYFMSQELAGLNTLCQHLPGIPLVIWLYGPLASEPTVISMQEQLQQKRSSELQLSIIILQEVLPGLHRMLEDLFAGGLTFADDAAHLQIRDADRSLPQAAARPVWGMRQACYSAIRQGWGYDSEHGQIHGKRSLRSVQLKIFSAVKWFCRKLGSHASAAALRWGAVSVCMQRDHLPGRTLDSKRL